jgi:hypothetical protein
MTLSLPVLAAKVSDYLPAFQLHPMIFSMIGLLLGKVDFANLFVVLKEGKTADPYRRIVNKSTDSDIYFAAIVVRILCGGQIMQ